MIRMIVALGVMALAGCGIDGEPIRPTMNSTVTLNNNGVSVGTQVGIRQGPLTVTLGL